MAAALDVRELGNQLDRIDDAQQKHSKELTDVVDKQKDLMHRVEKIGSTDLKRVTQQLDAESGKIVKLQDARKNIEDRLKAAEDLAKANKESNEDEIKRLKQVVAKLEIQAQDMEMTTGKPADPLLPILQRNQACATLLGIVFDELDALDGGVEATLSDEIASDVRVALKRPKPPESSDADQPSGAEVPSLGESDASSSRDSPPDGD